MIVCSVKGMAVTKGDLVKVVRALSERPSSRHNDLLARGWTAAHHMEWAVNCVQLTVLADNGVIYLGVSSKTPLSTHDNHFRRLRLMNS